MDLYFEGRPITWCGHRQGQRTRNSKSWALTLIKDYTQDRTQIYSKQNEPSPRSVQQFCFHDQTLRKLKYCPQPTSENVKFATTGCGQTMAAAKLTYRGITVAGLVHRDDVIHNRINQASTVFGRPRSTMQEGREVSLQTNHICSQTLPQCLSPTVHEIRALYGTHCNNVTQTLSQC